MPDKPTPTDRKYTKDHEWARFEGRLGVVGITDFAQDQLGDVVFVELPAVGAAVVKGEAFGVVESTKAVSELFAPVSGKVVEVNTPLVDTPEAINDDPYGEGWMVQIELSKPEEAGELMDAQAYDKYLAEESH